MFSTKLKILLATQQIKAFGKVKRGLERKKAVVKQGLGKQVLRKALPFKAKLHFCECISITKRPLGLRIRK